MTGCTGMLGASLLNILKNNNNYKLIILYRDKLKIKYLKKIIKEAKFINIDLTNSNLLNKKIKKYKIHAVIHMASSKISDNLNFENSLNSNFLMAFNLLRSIKNKKINHFIYTNTAAIYEQGYNLKENSPKSKNSYGYSKNIIAKFISNFCLNRKIYFKDLRIFSVFGEFENKNRLTAGAIFHAENKKYFFVKAPNQFRDYLYVDDVVDAILKSLNIKKNFSVNICSGKKIGTHKLIEIIFKKISDKKLIRYSKNKKSSFNLLSKLTGSNKFAKKILGWSPKYNINSGIDLMIARLKHVNKNIDLN